MTLAYRSRSRLSHAAEDAFQLYSQVFRAGDLEMFREKLLQQVLRPERGERLFELWVLLQVLETLNDLGAGGWSYRLLEPHASWFATCSLQTARVEVHCQHLPAEVARISHVRDYLRRPGVTSARSRLPDVVLRLKKPGRPPLDLLVEAKWSSDLGYISDSVYKMLGYVTDFGPALSGPVKGLLVTGGGITARVTDPDEPVWTTGPGPLKRVLADLICTTLA